MTRYAKTNVPGHPSIVVGKAYEIVEAWKNDRGEESAVIEVEDGQRIFGTIGDKGDVWEELACK
ncbi:hypothetical protein [Thalassospira marina]|uniref:Uncharacterized protein n=1 Tax=Thalassospira marina TaxID=2048283 RepID=A0A2N3KY01_9PROT|nr:hypothetical protein [Thalassospira marina]PKR55442.1 hypothetical protein COO20_04535 [Thalassospira marina]